ncbi:beta-sheet shell domain-containing protein, partial [Acinetobacter baumannii]
AKRALKSIVPIAQEYGVNYAKAKNPRNQIKLTVAVATETSMNIVLNTPKAIIYKRGVCLPVALPIGNTAAELQATRDNWADKMSYLVTKANAVECSLINNTLTTFNNRKARDELP